MHFTLINLIYHKSDFRNEAEAFIKIFNQI